jgi:hypothetical protein
MRATRRRPRKTDPLASPEAVRGVCRELRDRLPTTIPSSEKQLILFLYSVRHVERHPATDTLRGRPSRWRRDDLLEAASHLRAVLDRETQGRVSPSSFIGQYLQVLRFPADVTRALCGGEINLHEASQLARLTAQRLGTSEGKARSLRSETLRSHVAVRGSQTRLRVRIKELLGEARGQEVSSVTIAAAVAKVDEMLEVDPSDTRHLFWEEMKRLFFAMREVEPEDLDDEILEQFLSAADGLSNVLHRLERRRAERHRRGKEGWEAG